MICFRCGSHSPEGSSKCQSCGNPFQSPSLQSQTRKPAATQAQTDVGPFRAEDVVAGRYRVLRVLGTRPSGVSYRVVDNAGQRGDEELALHAIHAALLPSHDAREHFQRATGKVKKLNHPGLARIVDCGEDRGVVYVANALITGLQLARIIELRRDVKLFSPEECEPILWQLAQALEHLHRFAPHGALRPDNIWVQPDEVKVAEVMMLRGLPRKPYLQALGERVVYIAPELRGTDTEPTPAADIYSLGAILYELLTGQTPTAPDLSLVPEPVRDVLEKALELSAEHRFQSPLEMHQAFSAHLEDVRTEPRPLPPPSPIDDEASEPSKVEMLTKKREPAQPPPPPPDAQPVKAKAISGSVLFADMVEPSQSAANPLTISQLNLRAIKPASVIGEETDIVSMPSELPRSALRNTSRRREQRAERSPNVVAVSVFIASLLTLVGVGYLWASDLSRWFHQLIGDDVAVVQIVPTPAGASSVPTSMPASLPAGVDATALPTGLPLPPEPARPEPPPKLPKMPDMTPEAAKPGGLKATKQQEAAPQPAADPDKVVDKFGCARGMTFVPGGRFAMGSSPSDEFHNFSDRLLSSIDVQPFCIDRYEFPNAAGAVPIVNVTLKQAQGYCDALGKRLCSEEEWERACKGPAGTRFPYGNEFDETSCNVAEADGTEHAVRGAGTFATCRSGFGVIDLSGNVAEWTSSRMPNGAENIVKGGDAAHPDYSSRCANRSAVSPGKRAATLGFRCCSAPE